MHDNGNNVLSVEGTQKTFEALDCVRNTAGYSEACEATGVGYCEITGPTRFFENDEAIFIEQVGTDEDLNRQALSSSFYSNDVRAQRNVIFGNAKPIQGETLDSTLANFITISLPTEDQYSNIEDFENDALDNCEALRDSYAEDPNGYKLEYVAEVSTANESARGAAADLPLVFAAFAVMGTYCSMVLGSKHPVKSQALLGVGAVAGIVMSTSAGYGLALICGQSFTNLALILPFILVGVGLDDAFILTGEFALTNPEDSLQDRLLDMILKVRIRTWK